MAESKTSLSNLLWGPIESLEGTRKARLPSLCLTACGAAVWLMIAVNGFFSSSLYGYWAFFYVVILSLVAWGLYKMRKEAAIVALVVALLGLLSGGGYLKFGADLVMLLAAVAAIRGTLAYSLLNR
ncbi:MAG: hypothetical protein KAU27_09440 [Desulfuromonadales bacterium]|nr:hypothetical protein [Desulfuromonadales bacterium]